MGGAAGHMSHLHEDLEITFGEVKSILSDVADAEVEPVEKVDGQNIFFTWDSTTAQVKTARNPSDIRRGGMSPDEYVSKWKGHPAENAFVNGFEAIQGGINSLSEDQLISIFGRNGQNYVNAEIMYVGNPNIINYGADYIVLHDLVSFGEPDDEGDFNTLISAIDGAEIKVNNENWKIFGPKVVELQKLANSRPFENLTSSIDALGMSDSDTIGDFIEKKLRDEIIPPLKLSDQKSEALINIILGRESNMSLRDLKKGESKEKQRMISSLGTKANSAKIISSVALPVEKAISDFAVEVLRGVRSFFAVDHDSAVAGIANELDQAISTLQNYSGPDAESVGNMLQKQLSKLKGIERAANTTVEGIVFEYPPGSERIYKLTGAFAMINQIIGRARRIGEQRVNENLIRTYVRNYMVFSA